MDGFRRRLWRHLQRTRGMERFVRLVVAGGVALVAGLWLVTLFATGSPLWGLGVALALLGTGGLLGGIWWGLDY